MQITRATRNLGYESEDRGIIAEVIGVSKGKEN